MNRNAVHTDRQHRQVPVFALDFAQVTVRPVDRLPQDRFRMPGQPFVPCLHVFPDPLLFVPALSWNRFRELLAEKGKNAAGMDKTVIDD